MRATVWLNEDYRAYTAEDGQVFASQLVHILTELHPTPTYLHTHSRESRAQLL